MPGNSKSGNRTSHRGRPTRRRIQLNKDAAYKLRILLAQRNALRQQPMSEERLIEDLIEREWRELDEEYEENEENAQGFELGRVKHNVPTSAT